MVKVLHAADFHLDSAFGALSEERSRQRRQECRRLVDRMVDYANDHGAELMLLSGDLFDGERVYAQTAEELAAALGDRPAYLALREDMAKALGQQLALRLGPDAQILCIDRVKLKSGDYLDVGMPVGPALPVVIKTLILSK